MRQPDVSIVMPCHNEAGVIAQGIESILEQSDQVSALELVVVANGCTDDSAAIAASYNKDFPVKVLESSKPSKKRALNLGITAARSKTLLCTDADTVMRRGAIQVSLDLLDTDGTRLVGAQTEPIYDRKLLNDDFCVTFAALHHARRLACRPHKIVSGPLMLFNRELLRDTLFPEGAAPDDYWLSAFTGHHYGLGAIEVSDETLISFTPPLNQHDLLQQQLRYRGHRQTVEREHPPLQAFFQKLDAHCAGLTGLALRDIWRDYAIAQGIDFDAWYPAYKILVERIDKRLKSGSSEINPRSDAWPQLVSTKQLITT